MVYHLHTEGHMFLSSSLSLSLSNAHTQTRNYTKWRWLILIALILPQIPAGWIPACLVGRSLKRLLAGQSDYTIKDIY